MMKGDEPSLRDRWSNSVDALRTRSGQRHYRRVPSAITPLTPGDIAAGIAGQRNGTGRREFGAEIGSFLSASGTASYTSFRRALCGCLLEIAGTADGDRTNVVIPAFCSSDFPDAIDGAGLTALRYDVDAETLSADLESLTDLPTENTLAVVAINVLGYSSPMDRLEEYCRENDTYLIEALGYAFGAEYEGRRLGTFGDCSVLNFQQGKPIPIGGGMVVSRDSDLEFTDDGRPAVAPNVGLLAGYAALSHPRPYYLYSRVSDALDRLGASTADVSTHPESKVDVPYEPPFATISNFQGTVGQRVMKRLPRHRRQRADTAEVYATELADCPHVRHVQPVDGLSNHQYVRYPLVVDSTALRDELRTALSDIGIETAALYSWPPIDGDRFPGASRLQDGIITLPTHPYVDRDDRQRIVETVRAVATAWRG